MHRHDRQTKLQLPLRGGTSHPRVLTLIYRPSSSILDLCGRLLTQNPKAWASAEAKQSRSGGSQPIVSSVHHAMPQGHSTYLPIVTIYLVEVHHVDDLESLVVVYNCEQL